MAYNEFLAERIDIILQRKGVLFHAKKMMGGLCFMVDDKMCIGVVKDELMARVHPDLYLSLLTKKGAQEMDFTGRPMKGYLFISPDGTDTEDQLEEWVQLCLDFNPLAKSSKKKK